MFGQLTRFLSASLTAVALVALTGCGDEKPVDSCANVKCSAIDACHDAGICDSATGQCKAGPSKVDGTACLGADLCVANQTCLAGLCVGGVGKSCSASDQCHDPGVCNPATGTCSDPVKSDGSVCSDGNACTQTDTCVGGACLGTKPVTCGTPDSCHQQGVCNSDTGTCPNPIKTNGVTCSTDLCKTGEVCTNGTCGGGATKTCVALDDCHIVGVCDSHSGLCSNEVKPDASICDDHNACTTGESCVGGACLGGTTKTCVASDQCHASGVCDRQTGACSNPVVANGTACTSSDKCLVSTVCTAGSCGGTPKTCGALDGCHQAGTCDSGSGDCSNPTAADGTTCSGSSKCLSGETCTGGSCGGGTAKSCLAADQCHAAGVCDSSSGACSNPPVADGTACSVSDLCVVSTVCTGGSCSGQPKPCDAGYACDPTDGQCKSTSTPLSPVIAQQEGGALGLTPGLACDKAGNIYQAGSMFAPGFDFGSGLINSAGSSDAFVVKLNALTGLASSATWAKDFGDSQDQTANGVAAGASQIGFIGTFGGTMDIGNGHSLSNSGNPISFVAGLDAATGKGLWIVGIDLNDPSGSVGNLMSMASNASGDRFAVCGYSPKLATSILTDSAAVAGGGSDIIVAVFNAANGSLVWGKQFGGTNEQLCNAVAFDDAGNVYVTGPYQGTLQFGALAALTTPSGSNKAAYVAKLDGATGTPLAAAAFGRASSTVRATPKAIAVDASGAVAISGQVQGGVTFGATTLVVTGSSFDVFIAKLDTSLAPVWAKQLGGTGTEDVRGIAADSTGRILVAGVSNSGTTTGVASLTSGGGTDAFLLRLEGATGNVTGTDAHLYGDANGQEAFGVVVNRLGTDPEKDAVWMSGGFTNVVDFGNGVGLTGSAAEARKFLVKLK